MKIKRIKSSLFFFFIISVILIMYLISQHNSNNPSVSAQTSCTNPSTLSSNDAWTQGAVVSVNIDPAYNTDQRNAIKQAFQNWNSAATASKNCSNVIFSNPTFNSTPIAGPGINPTSSTDFKYQIFKANPPDGSGDRGLTLGAFYSGTQAHVWSYLNTNVTLPEALKQLTAHEIGHSFGLGECSNCGSQKSVMNSPVSSYNDTNGLSAPNSCDNATVKQVKPYTCPTPTPPPPPGCEAPEFGFCREGTIMTGDGWCCPYLSSSCQYGERRDCFNCEDELDNDGDFDTDYDDVGCLTSPIVVDTAGNGFNLTGSQSGVRFDLDSNGIQEQIAWTVTDSDDAFLALDRNGNGAIDNGEELFGDVTPQPVSDEPNGFLALAEYDKAENGGNLDDQIDASDGVFTQLRLWQDANHNGVSEANELKTLSSLGLAKIELDYKESKREDEHGNLFKYRAKVKDERGRQIGRWAWDVFLRRLPRN